MGCGGISADPPLSTDHLSLGIAAGGLALTESGVMEQIR